MRFIQRIKEINMKEKLIFLLLEIFYIVSIVGLAIWQLIQGNMTNGILWLILLEVRSNGLINKEILKTREHRE